ncbi:hypothetical protein P7K49_017228 [Saguinus oedipus]|uniref:Flavoprotein domain-containing protein n=1 Tax=Saguinus oedipus TaxID=9490 RepID=A0ABQ9V4L3_SAGOE|nr:hypothetical protein P7K49_017228 [Saguinus oedipus]
MWKCRSDPVLHIDLRRWADLLLVAPLDANTLGKVASGICDNLLCSHLCSTEVGTALVLMGQPDLPLLSRNVLLSPALSAQPGAEPKVLNTALAKEMSPWELRPSSPPPAFVGSEELSPASVLKGLGGKPTLVSADASIGSQGCLLSHFLTVRLPPWTWDLGEMLVLAYELPLGGVSSPYNPEGLTALEGTCIIRAWDRSKPLLFCPAMNTAMWEHPITAQQVDQLKAFGYVEIPCVAKKLVCGDKGMGAMAEVGTIVDKVKEVLFQHSGFQQS